MFDDESTDAREMDRAQSAAPESHQAVPRPQGDSGKTPDILPPLYRELLKSCGRLEEEVYRRTLALATLGHEIKNPLAIITGYIEILLSGKAGPLTDKERKILEETLANCGRLQRLAQDFLSYGALEAGNSATQLNLVEGDLNLCLSEVCGYCLAGFSTKGVALYFMADTKLRPFRFDYYKIQQIVSNLLENALKFTPAGGTVWITAEPYLWERRRHQDSAPAPERRQEHSAEVNVVRVTVADTGIGIAPEFHHEVFEDFYRVPGTENQSPGVGLGLAISRRLVQLHRGKIWVESELGAGSKFCFLLPLEQPGS